MRYIKYQFGLMILLISILCNGQLPNIVFMEYYYDNDPGFGNGIPVAISPDSLIEVNFDADLSSVSQGFHILNVRTKDQNNNRILALHFGPPELLHQ